jgi:predicted alpha/beta superfamily hydrolase
MNFKLFLLAITTFWISAAANAQITCTGIVVDEDSRASLPFVNIGIRHKNIGTASQADGTFSIKIPAQNENDTVTFSMVGYEELNLPVKNFAAHNQKTISLKVKTTVLTPAIVTAQKLVEKKYGIKNTGTVFTLTDGSTNQDDIFEIAQLIKLDTSLSKITSVNLHITESRNDSGTFRINFYGFDGNRPAERIVEKSIVQKKKITEGWLKFDLSRHNVYLKGNIVVALEFIPAEKKNNPIYYEVKLGGSSKSFVRTSSQGEWNVPPHHYRLFVTALVADEKHIITNDEEENATVPAAVMYSESVRDSFSVFIHLPKGYAKKKSHHFPVIYLLDANVYFDAVANAIEENKVNAILIGIGYKDFLKMDSLRTRDYLYPSSDELPISGGANKFLNFIEKELKPYVNKAYPVDTTNQTLMGHSFGGYFALYALSVAVQKNNIVFKNYVAASPSLDYSDNYLLKQFESIAGILTVPQYLFVTYGGREDREDGGTGTAGIDGFNSLLTILSGKRYGNINVNSEVYANFGHMETAVPTFTKAIEKVK